MLQVIHELQDPADERDELSDPGNGIGSDHQRHSTFLLDGSDDRSDGSDCWWKQGEASAERREQPQPVVHEAILGFDDVQNAEVLMSQPIAVVESFLVIEEPQLDVPELALRRGISGCWRNERNIRDHPAVRDECAQKQPDDDAASEEGEEDQNFRQ